MKRRHLVLGGASLLARPLWAQDAPETPAATPVSLYDPTRYVFAADEGVAQVLVVDLEEGRQIDKIRMPVAIRVLSSSTDKPYLAVSDRRRYAIILYDLENRDMREIPIPSRAMRMVFVPESSKLAVVFEDRIGMVDYRSGEVNVPEKTFQNLYTRFSTIFSVYSQTFWVLQENTPLIYQYSFLNPEAGWQTIDIGETRGLGRGAPTHRL